MTRQAQKQFRSLDAEQIICTVRVLRVRIEERFPGAGLGKLVGELETVASETVARLEWVQRPHYVLRAAAGFLTLVILAILAGLLLNIRQYRFTEFAETMQALDATISSVVFIGAAILFLLSWENRIKRNRALSAIHELRSLAHIVDMHQLTKSPEYVFGRGSSTASSPVRSMTPFELSRYLDYCCEALALISKITTLYVQGFPDPVLLDAVDDMEDLTDGLSRKIGQKLGILEALGRSLPTVAPELAKAETSNPELRTSHHFKI